MSQGRPAAAASSSSAASRTKEIQILPIESDANMKAHINSACHNATQRRVFAMNGTDVEFFAGRITEAQLRTNRPSYINAVLIQSRGVVNATPCRDCGIKYTDGIKTGPFVRCMSVAGEWNACCGNCKWRDYASKCAGAVAGTRPVANVLPSRTSRAITVSDEEEEETARNPRTNLRIMAPPSRTSRAITVSDEDEDEDDDEDEDEVVETPRTTRLMIDFVDLTADDDEDDEDDE